MNSDNKKKTYRLNEEDTNKLKFIKTALKASSYNETIKFMISQFYEVLEYEKAENKLIGLNNGI
ncbi:hypothetical protein [Methanococcus voltae]|uniref:Uncharacterized protein n=1 Tax=Methanococcus voltae (strain ATCC BAA-1334 / A3) TaxID=456320 RepID=D7DSL7_METV3|nr:hypothetical protein [Methanococcus voltae]MCS3901726.1 hypothetical protein [Methanococcus voltae]